MKSNIASNAGSVNAAQLNSERIEAVVGMALHGNPGDTAVACLLEGRRFGKRCGRSTNCGAALLGVELALDHANGRALSIVSCSTYASEIKNVGHQYGEISSRILAKIGDSVITFRRKRDDHRFEIVNAFARHVLDSGDAIWEPGQDETEAAIAKRAEHDLDERIESPAESWVLEAMRHHFPIATYWTPSRDEPWRTVPALQGRHGLLIPQFKIGKYRADFGIIGEKRKLVVEVDGWTYHNSRESFENDRRRDREIAMHGWQVLRFTASEAKYEPMTCTDQVLEILQLDDE